MAKVQMEQVERYDMFSRSKTELANHSFTILGKMSKIKPGIMDLKWSLIPIA